MKKKILTFIFLITVFSNYSNILKAEIIEGFCLVKRIDLKKAKLKTRELNNQILKGSNKENKKNRKGELNSNFKKQIEKQT